MNRPFISRLLTRSLGALRAYYTDFMQGLAFHQHICRLIEQGHRPK
jgi:hypothetical protein